MKDFINGGLVMLDIQIPNIEVPDLPTQYMWSDTQFEIIKKYITEYEKNIRF